MWYNMIVNQEVERREARMKLAEYMKQVRKDAMEQMLETYELLSWDDEWADLCASSMVTGRETGRYCGYDFERACEAVKDLVWDFGFQQEFEEEMGCDIVRCNEFDPIGFDVDVRLFCLVRLEDELRDAYMRLVIFGE